MFKKILTHLPAWPILNQTRWSQTMLKKEALQTQTAYLAESESIHQESVIFENLKRVADTMVLTFGQNCEVAIHDLANYEKSLIYIVGKVTGRKPGAPITDLVVKELRRHGDTVHDITNYQTLTNTGRTLKSTTTFIRNQSDQVIGAFCVNFDITDFKNTIYQIKDLIATEDMESNSKHETFASSVEETIQSLVEDAASQIGKQPSLMTREEKIKFVHLLDEMGAFAVKGAVDMVAGILGVTIYTVYNYQKKYRSNQQL